MAAIFAQAAAWATWTATAFIALGVVGALAVERAAGRPASPRPAPRGKAARPTR